MMPTDAPQDHPEALFPTVTPQNAPAGVGGFVGDESPRVIRTCEGTGCGASFIPYSHRQRFAPGHVDCRRRLWELKHPRLPRKHPKAWGRHKLKPTAKAILAMLRVGPVKVTSLWHAAGPGFSTRVAELRVRGHRVVYDATSKLYALKEEGK